MSNLQLHLKLDKIVAGKFIDHSDYEHKTTIQGTVTVVDDDEFTHVASFAGVNPSIRLPEVGKLLEEKSFTLETWVKIPTNAPSTLLPILTTEDSDPNKGLAIGLINRDRTHPGFHPFIGNPNPQTATDDSLHADQWYHLAFVYDYGANASGTNAIQKIFVNGHLASSSNHPAFEGVGELKIGGGNPDNHLLLSNVRVYSGALSESEIKHDMYQDRPHFAFQEMYPLDFSLRDPDKQEALYLLDEGKDLVYTLEIRNTSKEVIHLKKREAKAGFYHFALRFRPGVLAADRKNSNSIKITESNQDNWDIDYSSTATRDSQHDTLYFSWKRKGAAKSLSPNERLDITLENLRVDVTGGSRGTRIELLTDNLYFHSEGNEKIQIVRENHINIISYRGQKNIPLHVGFIGSNTVINNNEENSLTLRITNLLKNKSIEFSADPPSQISISFDVDSMGNENEEFALGGLDEVRAISITHPAGWEGDLGEEEIPIWTFQPQESIDLGAEQHITFAISKIITRYPTGQTNLKVSYQNIPGYWDGHFVVPIEKQPLIMRKDRVGIGTNRPATELEVVGTVKANEVITNSIHSFFAYDASKSKKLRASQGQENSQFGYSVAISSDWAIVGTPGDTINGQEGAGSATIFYRGSDGNWETRNKLQSANPQKNDYFGSSVAIYGDWAIVGALYDSTKAHFAGAVYLFHRQNNNDWVFHSKIHPSNPSESSRFGNSVAIWEDWFIVGAWYDDTKAINAGSAYLFYLENDGTWKQKKKIQAFKNENNQQVDDQQESASFGTSVAISGNWALVGAPKYNSDLTQVKDSGAAYIFQLENNTWTGHSKIRSDFPEEYDLFGGSVGISGEWIIVGAENKKVDSIVNAGAAYLFHLDKNKTWKRHSRIEASDKRSNHTFGYSVAIAVNWAIVGAIGSDPDSLSMGAAYLFYRESDNQWREYSKLESSDPALFDMFGSSVAIDDHNAIVGAPEYSEKNTEAVYIFSKSPKGSIFLNQSTGNVGIGTNDPKIQLAIGDNDTGLQQQDDGELAVFTNNIERIRIDNNGNVGIGTDSPTHKFHVEAKGAVGLFESTTDQAYLRLSTKEGLEKRVEFTNRPGGRAAIWVSEAHDAFNVLANGNVGIGVIDPKIRLAIGDNGTGLQQQGDGELAVFTNNIERIRIDSNGKVGIGTNDPKIQLAVGDSYTGLQQQGDGELAVYTNHSERIRIDSSGRVGIGTTEPLAPLHVNGYFGVTAYWDDYLNYLGVHNDPNSGLREAVSILASNVIGAPVLRAYHVNTASDRRIKKVLSRSNGESDLELVNQLTVMNYQYIDVITNGDAIRKGFTAQEVEKLYPGSVTNASEFVPDVYELSDKTIYSEATSQLSICLKKAHHLEEGDEVRLIGKNGPKEVKVVKMVSDTEFIVANWDKEDLYENGQLFVYGKKVNDFKTVNYQELSVIGISATQELHKRLEAQEKEIKELKNLVASQASQIEQLLELCNQGLSKEYSNSHSYEVHNFGILGNREQGTGNREQRRGNRE